MRPLSCNRIIARALDAHDKRCHIRQFTGNNAPCSAQGKIMVIEKVILPFMKIHIARFCRCNTSQIPAILRKKYSVYLIAHNLSKRAVRYFHVAEYDNLAELVSEECMANIFTFLNKKMPAFLDDTRSLGFDVDNHC